MTQLTEMIRQQLFNDILEGRYKPGERIPTELETAGRFDASRVTVRRAYAALEEAGIIVRRKRFGTIVSDSYTAATGPIRTVAALMPLGDPFSRDFLETLCREAADQDAMAVVEPGARNGLELNRAALRLAANGIRDLVVWGLDRQLDAGLFARLRVLGVNLVFFDRILPGPFADYVGLDNRDAIETLLNAAVADGFSEFVFIGTAGLDVDSNRERCHYFTEACIRRGFRHDFLELPWSEIGHPGIRPECTAFFSGRPPAPCAAICVNDSVALAAVTGAPGNCRFYSVDGTPEALAAGITGYAQPMRKMAETCFAALNSQRRAGRKWHAREYRLKGELRRPC